MQHIPVATLLVALLWTLVPGDVRAQSLGGFYVSQELGMNFTPALGIEYDAANGRGSICDHHVNPFTDLMPAFCDDPNAPGTSWTNTFNRAGGILAGGAMGYRFTATGRLRLELEYFYRETAHNETSDIEGRGGVTAAKLAGEVRAAEERIDSVTSHNLFGNVYFDLANGSRVTPFVGVGAGVGLTSVDYSMLWVRNDDPDLITSIAQYFPTDRLDDLRIVQQNLASTASSEQAELAAGLFGYQVLFGLDIALTDAVSLGVKGRRVAFESLSDHGDLDWLRSHIASNRVDGSDPVTHVITTGGLVLYGFGVNLKFQF